MERFAPGAAGLTSGASSPGTLPRHEAQLDFSLGAPTCAPAHRHIALQRRCQLLAPGCIDLDVRRGAEGSTASTHTQRRSQ
jgi:hypothetical protein